MVFDALKWAFSFEKVLKKPTKPKKETLPYSKEPQQMQTMESAYYAREKCE